MDLQRDTGVEGFELYTLVPRPQYRCPTFASVFGSSGLELSGKSVCMGSAVEHVLGFRGCSRISCLRKSSEAKPPLRSAAKGTC